jgi:hypothetical protein
MTIENEQYATLKYVKEAMYDKCNFEFTNLKFNKESKEYGACTFEINGKKIEYRISKITPTKIGQFVSIWKRNKNGITEPFDVLDDFDFIVITAKSADKIGQFIFPKSILAENGIITQNEKVGKRGIRVYPSWDNVISKQAEKTKSWQRNFFVEISSYKDADLGLCKRLLQHFKNA